MGKLKEEHLPNVIREFTISVEDETITVPEAMKFLEQIESVVLDARVEAGKKAREASAQGRRKAKETKEKGDVPQAA
jgi:hypothetical protein